MRRALTAIGFDEAYSFSFVNGDRDQPFRRGDRPAATLTNPIDVNQSEMRASLMTGLLEAVQHNFNQGTRDVKLFEIGRVFEAVGADERPSERDGWDHDDRFRSAGQLARVASGLNSTM